MTTSITEYNEILEQAFLKTSRQNTQLMNALRCALEQLMRFAPEPSAEWWQDLDPVFEQGLLPDPRGSTHVFPLTESISYDFEVVVPHNLAIQNHLNHDAVREGLNAWIQSQNVPPSELVGDRQVLIAGHMVTVRFKSRTARQAYFYNAEDVIF